MREALERLLASLCEHERSADFAAAWGNPMPNEFNPELLDVMEPADAAFAALRVQPWDGGAIGGVEVKLSAPAALEELERCLGGLRELPPPPGGDLELEGVWTCPDRDLEAIVLVPVPADGEGVTALTIRRGR